jgi:hypothetical protein
MINMGLKVGVKRFKYLINIASELHPTKISPKPKLMTEEITLNSRSDLIEDRINNIIIIIVLKKI